MIKWNNSETHTWNLQITSTFNSVDPFQFTFPQNYLLAGKLLCRRVIYGYFSYGHQCRPEAGDRTCFSFLFFLLKVSLYLISFCDLQLSSWKADPGFAHYEYNGQLCFFFFQAAKSDLMFWATFIFSNKLFPRLLFSYLLWETSLLAASVFCQWAEQSTFSQLQFHSGKME